MENRPDVLLRLGRYLAISEGYLRSGDRSHSANVQLARETFMLASALLDSLWDLPEEDLLAGIEGAETEERLMSETRL